MPVSSTNSQTGRLLDEYLVVEARAGNRKAMSQLVKRWHPKLVAHAWRLTGDREQAHDAAQSGCGEIVRSLPKLRAILEGNTA